MADSGWSELPTDLLLSILSELSVVDVVRSAAVCRTWLAVVNRVCSGDLNLRRRQGPSPWLLFSGGGGAYASFYSVLDEKVYTFRRHTHPPIRDVHFVGSSHGWLFTVDHRSELRMFNPITGGRIDLPSVLTFDDVKAMYDERECLASYIVGHGYHESYMELDELGKYYYRKAILSSNPSHGDYMVVLLYNPPRKGFSFVKAGDKKWTTLRPRTVYVDAIFHEGQLCAVNSNAQLEVWDLSQHRPPLAKQTIFTPSQHTIFTPSQLMIDAYSCLSYLVVTPRGDLLHLQKIKRYFKSDHVDVFKVDIEGGRQVQMHSFEKYVMFLGINSAFCLLSDEFFPQRKSELLSYFSDDDNDNDEGLVSSKKGVNNEWDKVGIYEWEDGSFSHILPYVNTRMYRCPHLWITPTL